MSASASRARDTQFEVGDLAARGVFAGAAPTDSANPERYRDLGNGTQYGGCFSPTRRTVPHSRRGATRTSSSTPTSARRHSCARR